MLGRFQGRMLNVHHERSFGGLALSARGCLKLKAQRPGAKANQASEAPGLTVLPPGRTLRPAMPTSCWARLSWRPALQKYRCVRLTLRRFVVGLWHQAFRDDNRGADV